MSSRVLKKLHGENDLEIKELDEQSDVEIEIETGSKKKQINIYNDLLNQQSPSESEFKEDDNETEHTSNAANPRPCEQIKKKKKKRKKKSVKQTYRRSSEDNADMDEISRSVREVNKLLNTTNVLPTNSIVSNTAINKSLLQIQHKNLNPSYEMKRMFGSKVVQSEQQNRRRNYRVIRPMKSTWLVTPKNNWPNFSKTGIFMNIDQRPTTSSNSSKDILWFQFEHSQPYRSMQHQFLVAVETLDSDNIIKIINQQPYHIDSLIQLNELFKMSEDHAMGSELIEHAILAYETAFHPMFNIASTNCRLDYRRQENRGFFLVLFKHAQYLELRACSRTALELSKLILSLDPDNDPLAMKLVIDYYALRSKQYDWLIQFYIEFNSINKLSQLPNWAYSYAVALYYHHGSENTKLADDALQYALLMFPGTLLLLLNELSIQSDARVTYHKYFTAAFNSHSAALQQLLLLYVHRTKLIWKDEKLLPWLQKNVTIVLDKVDERKDIVIQEYAIQRNRRYTNPPRAILRHIILSDFKEKVPLSPFLSKTEPLLVYDPLPPLDSINIYERPSTRPSNNLTMSPLSMFFQSLIPTFNIEERLRQANQAQPQQQQQQQQILPQPQQQLPARQPQLQQPQLQQPQLQQPQLQQPQLQQPQLQQPQQLNANEVVGANVVNVDLGEGATFIETRNYMENVIQSVREMLSINRVPERPTDADADDNESSSADD